MFSPPLPGSHYTCGQAARQGLETDAGAKGTTLIKSISLTTLPSKTLFTLAAKSHKFCEVFLKASQIYYFTMAIVTFFKAEDIFVFCRKKSQLEIVLKDKN